MHDACGLGSKAKQRPDGSPGPAAGAQFEDLTQENERGDHGGCLEIDVGLVAMLPER